MTDPAANLPGGDPNISGPLSRPAAVALLAQAWDLAMASEYEQAAAAYGRLVGNADPEVHVAALLGSAEAKYRLDDEAAALQDWIVATQAPETSNTWRAWKALAAARVREGDVPAAARAYREAERRAPSEERPEISSRLGWLSKEMGEERSSERHFSRSRTGVMPTPLVTWAILAVTVGIGLAQLPYGGSQADPWIAVLGLIKPLVADGELWRLVTVTLVHGGLIHLGFNMYALFIVGPLVEGLYGSPRFALIYVLTAAAGSAASFVFSPGAISVGASGAVFGLFGMLLVSDRVHKPALTRGARNLTGQIGMLIAINLFLGFSIPNIDNAAHIGGLLAGAWLGFVLVPRDATLSSFWQRPGAQPASRSTPLGPASPTSEPEVGRRAGGDQLLRTAAVLAVVAVIAAAVAFGRPG
ncbi:MAG: rhomboid family intramembrane serine protease [Chloroflexota bacterium]|nr:rhomboid family intramembrane serine protease [Chloroflexota bacterium]